MDYSKIGIGSEAHHIPFNKPSFREIFMNMANEISRRSSDAETQHGAIFVKDNKILTVGYNGWPAGSKDDEIPNIRLDGFKYLYVIHAESNGIIDAARRGISLIDSTLYVTGRPCFECAKKLIQVGCKNWIIGGKGHVETEQQQLVFNYLVETHNVTITEYDYKYPEL